MKKYSSNFFSTLNINSTRSAKEITPWLLKNLKIESVVVVGCGSGAWLSVLKENGIAKITGYDGDWVDEKLLMIPKQNFQKKNLSEDSFNEIKADLVISLEVAEHLPESAAKHFVSQLTSVAPLVLFSAAIPGQEGTNHINEQWHSYWIELFEKYGFSVMDIRPIFWENSKIDVWYRQNIFLFYKNKFSISNDKYPLKDLHKLNIVHPQFFTNKVKELKNPENYSIKLFLKFLPKIIINKIKYKISMFY